MKFGEDIDVIDFLGTALKTSTFLSTIRRINEGLFPPRLLRPLTPAEIGALALLTQPRQTPAMGPKR